MVQGRLIKIIMLAALMLNSIAFATVPDAVPGEYIVKLRPSLSVSMFEKKALSEQLGSNVKTTIPELNLVVIKRASFELAESAIKTLNRNNLVEYSEPNYIYRINKVPNDPYFLKLWGLKNSGQLNATKTAVVAGVDVAAERARQIAIYFSRFETESDYDFVSIYDANGKLIGKISGVNNESMSQVIPGDYAKLVFTTDDSSEGMGFVISKIYFR